MFHGKGINIKGTYFTDVRLLNRGTNSTPYLTDKGRENLFKHIDPVLSEDAGKDICDKGVKRI